ncbi:MAG TPA: outer membrane lipoprotein-sorting protein [Gammaproteobacteria bacterium]|nr:outer membrane lipoprotein-sorting protein [Gammaproteobacteria bacterium]
MRFSILLAVIAPILTLFVQPSWATEDGDLLAQRVYERPDGIDFVSVGEMHLISPGTKPRIRRMTTYRLDEGAGGIRSLIRFSSPADMKGVGLLTHDVSGVNKEQLVFLPDLDRARRIASSRKGGRFVGSDIFFEDLRDRPPNLDKHAIVKAMPIGSCDCIVLESIPLRAQSTVYSKRLSWIDPDTLLAMKIEFYRSGDEDPIKSFKVLSKKKIEGYWTVTHSVMTDLISQHSTEIRLESIDYDMGLSRDRFSRRSLEEL